MSKPHTEAMVRVSATVKRGTRDKMRFLAKQRTSGGTPTSESRLWNEAGARYIQQQADMPGSRENTSRKISEVVEAQSRELAALRAEVAKLTTAIDAQRKFLGQLNAILSPILERLRPPATKR